MYQDRKEMGGRIAELRKIKGLTQAQLAETLGVQRTLVVYWETGERDIKSHQIIALANCLGVSCDYILRGVKAENLDINKRIGLSDKAIAALEAIKINIEKEQAEELANGNIGPQCSFLDVLNYLLGENVYRGLLHEILNYALVDFKIGLAIELQKVGLENKLNAAKAKVAAYTNAGFDFFRGMDIANGKVFVSVHSEDAKYAYMGKIADKIMEFTKAFSKAQDEKFRGIISNIGKG